MKTIKISCHDTTRAWDDGRNPMVFKFLPNRENIWKDCQFFWNDEKIKKADYWVIIGDVDLKEENCEVNPDNIIFMTGEPHTIKRYDVSRDFVRQFGRIYTSQYDFKHEKVFPCRPPLNWWIDEGSPIKSKEEFANWKAEGLSYEDFKNLRYLKKDKLLSVFCSNKIFTEGHKARFNFCQKLKNHFKDKLDWFGAGVRPIDNKWNGVAPYKYHIALENFQGPNYLTEKLIDPLVVLTHPIYCGATNIGKYFSNHQVTEIDIKYPKTAIAKIEWLIEEGFYEKNFDELLKARDLAMNQYNFYNLISDIVENDKQVSMIQNPQVITIRNEDFFLLQTPSAPAKSRKIFSQKIKKSLVKKVIKAKEFFTDFLLLIKFKFIKK